MFSNIAGMVDIVFLEAQEGNSGALPSRSTWSRWGGSSSRNLRAGRSRSTLYSFPRALNNKNVLSHNSRDQESEIKVLANSQSLWCPRGEPVLASCSFRHLSTSPDLWLPLVSALESDRLPSSSLCVSSSVYPSHKDTCDCIQGSLRNSKTISSFQEPLLYHTFTILGHIHRFGGLGCGQTHLLGDCHLAHNRSHRWRTFYFMTPHWWSSNCVVCTVWEINTRNTLHSIFGEQGETEPPFNWARNPIPPHCACWPS